MLDSKYHIKMDVFQGPLDLLLNLIEKRKLHINDVSLGQVADDYISYTKQLDKFPISETANFILIASTLVLIKSQALLPNLTLTPEEKENINDLEERLRLYKQAKILSEHVAQRFGKNIIFQKNFTIKTIKPVFSPDKSMTIKNILITIKETLKNIPTKNFIPQIIVNKVMSLEEAMDKLTSRIKSSLNIGFKEFSKIGKKDKINIIINFLAMLELVKQGVISVAQDKHFEDIRMETDSISIPKY